MQALGYVTVEVVKNKFDHAIKQIEKQTLRNFDPHIKKILIEQVEGIRLEIFSHAVSNIKDLPKFHQRTKEDIEAEKAEEKANRERHQIKSRLGHRLAVDQALSTQAE